MSLALAEAAGRYGHVMFPSNLHPPAVQLAQYLLEKGPGKGWAQRVFYSGNHDFSPLIPASNPTNCHHL